MQIKFSGAEADNGHVDLQGGGDSLAAFGHIANVIGHYVAEGKVRFRGPYTNKVQFRISSTQPGSLKVTVDELKRFGSEVRNAAAGLKLRSLFERVLNRAVGQSEEGALAIADEQIPAGDIDALAEAVTPSLTRAHRWINTQAKVISIGSDDHEFVRFDEDAKRYLEDEIIADNDEVLDVSVGALNVNSRNGRVYFHGLGRTVPFYVSKTANPRTVPTLSRYLTQYAEKTGATVNITFQRVTYADGRLKRIIVHDCFPIRDVA